ncbi:winged helix-turn-helix transcriptional regulator [Streptomyces acidiscabies]|uniref:winged helix-turn-helix transcriptional regulator n=1 Tax=Streptomyces acidiscabies TaxID=42234 RepID=UPI0009A11F10
MRWRPCASDDCPTQLDPPSPHEDVFLQGLHDVRHVISGEWTWDILVALHDGPLRFTRLRDTIRELNNATKWPGIKHLHLRDGPLIRTLRRLEQAELVRHTRESDFPRPATYELTPPARELLISATSLVLWAEAHADLLDRARQRREEKNSD